MIELILFRSLHALRDFYLLTSFPALSYCFLLPLPSSTFISNIHHFLSLIQPQAVTNPFHGLFIFQFSFFAHFSL